MHAGIPKQRHKISFIRAGKDSGVVQRKDTGRLKSGVQ
ncbi:hypothetical protein l13_08970 [Neisseria weaveri ATCC 51223]|nr:hypothetical protein l13_08970 [Neisseria weaveri ATCC 51223]